jgi:uncharacterized UPF0160 family protein
MHGGFMGKAFVFQQNVNDTQQKSKLKWTPCKIIMDTCKNFDGHLQNFDGHLQNFDGHLQNFDLHLVALFELIKLKIHTW